MGAEGSKLRASSLKLLRTLSGRRHSSKFNSSDNLSRSDRKKNSSSRQQSSNKPKSDSVRYKTKWPYPHVEKDFLPVYNMKAENQKDFTIVHIIASGAYGSVLRGMENKTKRDVAIKVIDKSRVLSEGQGAIQQCKDEVLIQSELPQNAYIVKLVSFWQTRNRLYLVLEYIPNGELFDLWKSLRIFSESLARFYLSQIAMAIDFLHRNNVVYRDLKMENILLDSDAHIKIIDFGLSKRLKTGDRTSTTCGTLQYTAPEVLRGEPYDHSVDWWSMGVLGYALMNGKFPVFGAKNHVEMRTMVANHQYRMPIHLSNEAADVLTMLLQKNVITRIKSLDDLMKIRFFKGCLNYTGPKLDLKQFITKEDLEKIPVTFHLKPLFEMLYAEHKGCNQPLITAVNDYTEHIWKMTSGKPDAGCPIENFPMTFGDEIFDKPSPERRLANNNNVQTTTTSADDRVLLRYGKPNPPPRTISADINNSQFDKFKRQLLTSPDLYKYDNNNHNQQYYSPTTDTNFTLPVTFDTYPRARKI